MNPEQQRPGAQEQTSLRRPITVGWKEYVAFPEWGIHRAKTKIDTGARTSALGVASYEILHVEGQPPIAELRLALSRKHPERITIVHAAILRMVHVKNTSRTFEERPLIETTIQLGPITKRLPMTITDRSGMRFPMILGRKALEGDFIVDVSKKYLLR